MFLFDIVVLFRLTRWVLEMLDEYPEQIIALGTILMAIGTIAVAILAIWGDWIKNLVWGPNIEICFSESIDETDEGMPYYKRANQDYDIIPRPAYQAERRRKGEVNIIHLRTDVLWIRFKIINKGASTAKNCVIKVNSIIINSEKQKQFDPAKLKWGDYEKAIGDIPGKSEGELVGLGCVFDDDIYITRHDYLRNGRYRKDVPVFILNDLISKEKGNQIEFYERGIYKFHISVSMENGKPVKKHITIDTEKIIESVPRLQNPMEEIISENEFVLFPTKTEKRKRE